MIARFHLDALSDPESIQYIEHRLAVAGHTGPLPFDAAALKRIHRLSRGVPRRINLLAGRALLGAWATGQHQVNRAVVDKAAAEVFGPDVVAAPAARARPKPWLAVSLGLLAGAGLTALLVWGVRSPASGPATPLPTSAASAAPPLARPASSAPTGAPMAAASAASAAAPALSASSPVSMGI